MTLEQMQEARQKRLLRQRNNTHQPSLTPAAALYAKKKEDDEEKNKGGLLGGLGYMAHKVGLGFMQGVEGIWDYAAGGIADLFGADEWAEEQFKSDWLDYNAADEWYNPGEGWKFAGDVAGGIGTSLPGIVTSVGLTVATGGAALPAVAGIGVGSLSAAGTSTKEAMLESGELTGKEYLFGAGMGAVEAVTEKLTGGIGAGVTKAAKSVGKVLGKVATKEVAESTAKKSVALSLKTAAKSAAKEFAGEAFEEGFAEWVAPYIARATYDPNAKNASAQEIFYSALVGGLAGVGMGGATGALTQGINYYSGKNIVKNGRTQQIMDLAKTYTEDGASDTEAANGIRELYGKLSSAVQSGAGLNREQQRMLGELVAFETQEQLRPMVQRSAIHAIQSADAVAGRLNAVGRYKMVDGKLTDTQANNSIPEGAEVREITAEDIRGTYDPKNKKSLAEALKTNDVLRYIAASDAAGRLMLTAKDVERSVLTGTRIHTQAELNEFITSASAEQKAAVGKELGIEDWNTLTVEEFAKKASAYRESGKAEAYKKKAAKVQKMQGLAESKARNIPRAIALADGAVQRYADADSNFAVARDGDTYIVYDYATGNVTRDMTRAEVNAALGRYRRSRAGSETSADVNAKNENTSEKLSSDDIVDLSDNNEISQLISENPQKNPHEVIKQYLVENFVGQTFNLSDGRKAIMDKRDATKLSGYSSKKGIAKLGALRLIIENAKFHHSAYNVEHPKFTSFHYYDIKYKYNGEIYDAWLNIGVAKNDGKNHIYDITNKNEEALNPKIDSRPVGNAIKNASSNDSIPDSAAKVNTSDEKSAKSLSEMLPMEEKAKPTAKQVKAAMEAKAQAAAIESLAKEKIKDYADLSKENQSMIRKVLREAMASGISAADALSYARVAARSGLDITFDKKACYNEEKGTYAAGFYDPEANRIVVNPETKKKHASLLIHELSHAIRSYIGKDGKRHAVPIIDDPDKISDAMWERIEGYYADQEIAVERAELMADEASAYYAEQMLGTDAAIDLLLGEKPTLKQKILSFFKQSARDYSTDAALSRESRKFLRDFKKTFDAFAARNQGRNIEAGNVGDTRARRFAINENIESEIDNALNNKFYRNHVKLTENTPDILLSQKGVRNLPLYMKPSHVRENIFSEQEALSKGYKTGDNINYHGLGKKKFVEVIADLDNVVEAYRGTKNADNPQRREKYFLLISKIKDADGNVINVPIYINEKADYHSVIVDTNKVATVFGKEELRAYLQKELKKGNLVRIKKKSLQVGDGTAPIAAAYDSKASATIIHNLEQKSNTSDEISLEKSTDSRRYSMDEAQIPPRKGGKSNLSEGQVKKLMAEYAKGKAYSKKYALEVISKLPFAYISILSNPESINIVAEAMWQVLNESIYDDRMTEAARQKVTHDIAEFYVASLMRDALIRTPDATSAREKFFILKSGVISLELTDAEKETIRGSIGEERLKSIQRRWSFKNQKNQPNREKISLKDFVSNVIKDLPELSYLQDMNPASALIEIDDTYKELRGASWEMGRFSEIFDFSEKEVSDLISDVEKELLNSYKFGGNSASFVGRMQKKINHYKNQADFINQKNYLAEQAQRMRDLNMGTYANMTQDQNNIFKGTIGRLARIKWRGTVYASSVVGICKDLHKWYTDKEVKEKFLNYSTKDDPGLFNEGIAEMLEALSQLEGNLGIAELQALSNIMSYFTNFVESYGKVYRKGQWVDAKDVAKRYIDQMNQNKRLRIGLIGRIAKTGFFKLFGDPMSLARRMDCYESGFYTEMLEELREGAKNAAVYEMNLLEEYDAFLKEHKNYTKKAADEICIYRGEQIPKLHLISLYMTFKRPHARAGLVINGFKFGRGEGAVHVDGLVDPGTETLTDADIDFMAEEQMREIEKLLSDEDKKYVFVLEKVYNQKARDLKAMRDKQRLGYTNVSEEYYYPIRRYGRAENVDSANVADEIDRISRASFNKDIVKGAKQKLYIEAADALFLRHCRAVSQYAAMMPAIDAYNMLYNLDISGNPNDPKNVARVSETVWGDGNKYYRNIIADIQGARSKSEEGAKALSFIRGGYAKYQLGANPKVWFTQLSSVFASSSILDADAITKGFFTVKGDDVDKYCDLARLRNYDNTAARAQGVLDKPLSARETKAGKLKKAGSAVVEGAGKLGDISMIPIGFMDRFVITRLFAACQVQVAKEQKLDIGTRENKTVAGELLEKVIFETQQNSLATERSAAMRSGNEFYRALTMFRSDSMKVIGRVIDGFGEVSALKGLLKNNEMNADSRKELEARLKRAEKKTAKASVALILSAVFMALIAQGFRWLYAKEKDEDETFAETLLVDSLGNMLGGLPGFADVYTKMVEGYDVGNYSYSAINDVLDSAKGLFDIADGLLTGEGTAQERMRAIRNASYSLGQVLGIPTRNVYNVLYGLTKRVSKKAGYAIDNAFYEKNYKTDLYKAMEDGNDDMTTYIMGLLLGERLDQSMDDAVFSEILALSKNGYKVLPRTMPKTLTVNDEEYELTDEEQAAIRAEYSAYTEGLSRLVSHRSYAALTDEEKEYAMDYVSDLYYDMALQSALGVERENKDLILSRALSVDMLALYRTSVRGLASDKDKDGNTVAGSKRKKVIAAINALGVRREERLLLIASSGYALQDGDVRGMSAEAAKNLLLRYILSMKISKDEKAALAKACGFTVKNGKILKNSA